MIRLDRLTAGDLPITLGGYELVVVLGERGEGRVFRADAIDGRKDAEITALWPSLLASPGMTDEIAEELAALHDFTHPAAVRVLDVGRQRSTVWFASEPIVGVTLGEITSGPLRASARQVLEVAVAVLDVLDAAHGRRRDESPQLHRGLTPDRILVTEQGAVKVRGFGLGALPLGTGESGRITSGSWASPEQIGRRTLGTSSDLFSLGAIILFALTRRAPFRSAADAIPSERVGEIVRVLARGEIFSRVESLAMGLGSVMQGLLALDPASRFSSAGQAREALRAVASRLAPGEPLGALAGRMLVDHASTVAALGGALPASRDLLPIESLAPTPLRSEETADTDADFLLPSQRIEAKRMREEESLEGLDLDVPSALGVEVETQRLPQVPEPSSLPPDLGSRPTAAVFDDVLATAPPRAPLPLTPRLPSPDRPLVAAPPREPVPAPRPAPVPAPRPTAGPGLRPPDPPPVAAPPRVPVPAPRPTPVAAPRPSPIPVAPGLPPRGERPVSAPPAWAPPLAPPSSGLRSSGSPPLVLRGPSAPAHSSAPADSSVPKPHKRLRLRPDVEIDEGPAGGSGRIVTVVALVGITLGILGLLGLQFTGDHVPSRPDTQELSRVDTPAPVPAPEREPTAAPELPTEQAEELTPAPERAELPVAVREPTPRRTITPTPVEMPAGPVTLGVKHRPLKKGQAGSSDLLSVRIDGPDGTTVTLHHGPTGGPYQQLPLRAKSGGRFEEWLNFPSTPGLTLEYWVVATHPAAAASASSGSRSNPHRLALE